jgi:hypothetical protein
MVPSCLQRDHGVNRALSGLLVHDVDLVDACLPWKGLAGFGLVKLLHHLLIAEVLLVLANPWL